MLDFSRTKTMKIMNEELDLETLKAVHLRFMLYSDHSTRCLGFNALEKMIKEQESKAESGHISDVRLSCPPDEKIGEIVTEIAYTQKAGEQGDDYVEKIWLLKSWIDENILQGYEA